MKRALRGLEKRCIVRERPDQSGTDEPNWYRLYFVEDERWESKTTHMKHIDMLDYHDADDPAAMLIRAIEEEWVPPVEYQTPEQREAQGGRGAVLPVHQEA